MNTVYLLWNNHANSWNAGRSLMGIYDSYYTAFTAMPDYAKDERRINGRDPRGTEWWDFTYYAIEQVTVQTLSYVLLDKTSDN